MRGEWRDLVFRFYGDQRMRDFSTHPPLKTLRFGRNDKYLSMEYLLYLLTLVGIYCIATLATNLIAGFTGRLSLQHGALMAIGAYSFAILLQQGFSYGLAFVFAGVFTGLVNLLFSFPLLRLKEDSFVLVSFGFAFMVYDLILNLPRLTGGALGIKGIAAPHVFDFSSRVSLLILVFMVLLLFFVFLKKLLGSSYGVILKAIREQETISEMMGHDRQSYRRSMFIVSGIVLGFSGAFLASFISAIDPLLFTYYLSVLLIMMTIVGGLASLSGSLLGATILILLPEVLRFLGVPNSILAETQHILYGLTMVVLMVMRPVGISGKYRI